METFNLDLKQPTKALSDGSRAKLKLPSSGYGRRGELIMAEIENKQLGFKGYVRINPEDLSNECHLDWNHRDNQAAKSWIIQAASEMLEGESVELIQAILTLREAEKWVGKRKTSLGKAERAINEAVKNRDDWKRQLATAEKTLEEAKENVAETLKRISNEASDEGTLAEVLGL